MLLLIVFAFMTMFFYATSKMGVCEGWLLLGFVLLVFLWTVKLWDIDINTTTGRFCLRCFNVIRGTRLCSNCQACSSGNIRCQNCQNMIQYNCQPGGYNATCGTGHGHDCGTGHGHEHDYSAQHSYDAGSGHSGSHRERTGSSKHRFHCKNKRKLRGRSRHQLHHQDRPGTSSHRVNSEHAKFYQSYDDDAGSEGSNVSSTAAHHVTVHSPTHS